MPAVIVQLCVDPRLNHELLRAQVRQKLGRRGLSADRVYLVNEVGGNLGSSFRTTLDLLAKNRDPVVLCAVLHHDDCGAAAQGLRAPLETTAQQITSLLAERGVSARVLTGQVLTASNTLLWSDEPGPRYQPHSFGVFG